MALPLMNLVVMEKQPHEKGRMTCLLPCHPQKQGLELQVEKQPHKKGRMTCLLLCPPQIQSPEL